MEDVIFRTLRHQAATSSDLLTKVYPRPDAAPFNAQIVVNKAVLTLGKKLKRNREPWQLKRTKINGKRLIENRLVRSKTKLVK